MPTAEARPWPKSKQDAGGRTADAPTGTHTLEIDTGALAGKLFGFGKKKAEPKEPETSGSKP